MQLVVYLLNTLPERSEAVSYLPRPRAIFSNSELTFRVSNPLFCLSILKVDTGEIQLCIRYLLSCCTPMQRQR